MKPTPAKPKFISAILWPTCSRRLVRHWLGGPVRRTIAFAWQLGESRHTSVIGHDGDEHGRGGCAVLGGRDMEPEPFANGLPGDPVATSASRLNEFHDDPADEAKPLKTGQADSDHVDDCHQCLTHRAAKSRRTHIANKAAKPSMIARWLRWRRRDR